MAIPARLSRRVFIDDVELAGVQSVIERLQRGSEHPFSWTLKGYHVPGIGFDTSPYIVNRSAVNDVLRYEFYLNAWVLDAHDGNDHLYTPEQVADIGAKYANTGVKLLFRDGFVIVVPQSDPGDRVSQWCEANGYTDQFHQEGQWWAFPPNGVMPVLIDALIVRETVLRDFSCRCIPLISDVIC